jgi:hypothetical protein
MAKSEQPQTGDRTRGTLWHTNAFGKVPPLCLRPEFVHPGCTNIELPLGSERGLSGNEHRQHFDCATWLHKAREMPKEQFKRWGAPS